ncbi:uncharacterized protein BXZ73DRAFT_109964 [Epithele typhae]|uniref:uncharacterized protein n=1 Tax=Epithele typhae TaxID=378194 RepID=UPI002007BC1A|nr:uncharacterized protein BXZ73DRAFT_109964 [Epithele typhae]KAH9908240.1 hypothetical protein BXZ73DRAFT_109964 [Epithele typhae]
MPSDAGYSRTPNKNNPFVVGDVKFEPVSPPATAPTAPALVGNGGVPVDVVLASFPASSTSPSGRARASLPIQPRSPPAEKPLPQTPFKSALTHGARTPLPRATSSFDEYPFVSNDPFASIDGTQDSGKKLLKDKPRSLRPRRKSFFSLRRPSADVNGEATPPVPPSPSGPTAKANLSWSSEETLPLAGSAGGGVQVVGVSASAGMKGKGKSRRPPPPPPPIIVARFKKPTLTVAIPGLDLENPTLNSSDRHPLRLRHEKGFHICVLEPCVIKLPRDHCSRRPPETVHLLRHLSQRSHPPYTVPMWTFFSTTDTLDFIDSPVDQAATSATGKYVPLPPLALVPPVPQGASTPEALAKAETKDTAKRDHELLRKELATERKERKEEYEELKKDVAELKKDVAEIKNNVAGIKKDVERLNNKVEEFAGLLKEFKEEFAGVNDRLDRLLFILQNEAGGVRLERL